MEIPDRTKDVCVECGKEITYDKEDGYWDSFQKEEGGVKYYTPECTPTKFHEPINYICNEKGYYIMKRDEEEGY
jgi:hypothetical protein